MEMLLIFHSFFLCRSFILQKLVRFTLFIHCSFLGRERFIFVLSELLFSFFSFFEKKITFLQSVAALVYRCHLTTQAKKKPQIQNIVGNIGAFECRVVRGHKTKNGSHKM